MQDALSILTPVLSKTRIGGARPGADLRDSLTDAGLSVIGSGAFGAVFEDRGRVFKIYDQHEPGYGCFVKYLDWRKSVLLPTVEKVGQIGRWQVIAIERLIGVNDAFPNNNRGELSRFINNVVNHILLKRGETVPFWWVQEDGIIPEWDNLILDVGYFEIIVDEMITFYKSQATEQLVWDIHASNFMFRKVGDKFQFVLTDPWTT